MRAVVSGKMKNIGQIMAERVKELGYEVYYHEDEKVPLNEEELKCDVLVQMDMFKLNKPESFKNLKFVQALMVGTDDKPIEELRSMGVKYANLRGVFDKPIAEFVIMRILDIYKRIRVYESQQREKIWKKQFDLMEITDKRTVVLGTGHIGKETARLLKAFEAKVDGFSRSGKKTENFDNVFTMDFLNEKIGQYDIVVNALPLTDETYHVFNDDLFGNFKEKSVYINIGRGGTQSEEALYKALLGGRLMAAAVDVFEKEPLSKESPLLDLDNFYFSPHNSWGGDLNDQRTVDIVVKNLKAFINGEEPENIV